MIVSGFVEPITKELPLEYAVEMNRLIQLQMEGSVGSGGRAARERRFHRDQMESVDPDGNALMLHRRYALDADAVAERGGA